MLYPMGYSCKVNLLNEGEIRIFCVSIRINAYIQLTINLNSVKCLSSYSLKKVDKTQVIPIKKGEPLDIPLNTR